MPTPAPFSTDTMSDNALVRAEAFAAKGICPVPTPRGEKGPQMRAWNALRLPINWPIDPTDNLAMLTGDASGDIVVIDQDCSESLKVADLFPATRMVWGTPHSPASKLGFVCQGLAKTVVLKDPRAKSKLMKEVLLELRVNAIQQLPGSLHPNGQRYRWDDDGSPAHVTAPALLRAFHLVGTASLLLRYWPAQGHETRLGVAGWLLNSGMEPDEVKRLLVAVQKATGRAGESVLDAEAAVNSTVTKLNEGSHVTGYSVLLPTFGELVLEQISKWLGLRKRVRAFLPDVSLGAETVSDLPIVMLGPDEARVADEVCTQLARLPNLFQYNGKLVEVRQGEDSVHTVNRDHLRNLITTAVRLVRRGADGALVPASPPPYLALAILGRRRWPVKRLRGFLEHPFIRADGSAVTTNGYDPASEIFLNCSCAVPPLPQTPTKDDALQAVMRLQELLSQVPFLPNHFMAWLAALLTLPALPSFVGDVPLMLVDANAPRVGKGLVLDVLTNILIGRGLARMPFAPSVDEQRKALTSLALSGQSMVLFDNVTGDLGSSALDAWATKGGIWQDRLLGTNEAPRIETRAVLFFTANNARLVGDTAARTLHIRLETNLETPEERGDLVHKDLPQWVRDHRPELLRDVLTILAAYKEAGRPAVKLTPWGSFHSWSEAVRRPLVWLGLPDPAITRTGLRETADQSRRSLLLLLHLLAQKFPNGQKFRARDIVLSPNAALQEAFDEMSPRRRDEGPGAVRIGQILGTVRGRAAGGLRLVGQHDRTGTQTWAVERVAEALPGGS